MSAADKDPWDLLQAALLAIGVNDLTPSHADEVEVCELIIAASGGDHIAVRTGDDVAWHHGIFGCGGSDAKVIDNRPDGGVRVSPFSLFMKNARQVAIVRYENDSAQRRNYTLWIAGVVAEWQPAPVYDVLRFNCESFASWCRTTRWDEPHHIGLPRRQAERSCKAHGFAGTSQSK